MTQLFLKIFLKNGKKISCTVCKIIVNLDILLRSQYDQAEFIKHEISARYALQLF